MLACLGLMAVLECVPFWILPFFPSQDGPSHLYNAAVLANYWKEPAYQAFYSMHVPVPGNIAAQAAHALLVVAGLPPAWGERLLLTTYMLALPASLLYLLRGLKSASDVFAFFGILLAPSWFLHMGFYNFCFALPLALAASGFYIRHSGAWGRRDLFVFWVAGSAAYLMHAVVWAGMALAVMAWELYGAVALQRARPATPAGALRRAFSGGGALALASLLPPGFLILAYSISSKPLEGLEPETFRQRLWGLYSLSFLHAGSVVDHAGVRAVAVLLACLLAITVAIRWRARLLTRRSDVFAVLSGLFAVLSLVLPSAIGGGGYLPHRLAFWAFLFLLVWLAAQDWPRWALWGVALAVPAITLAMLFARLPGYRNWSDAAGELRLLGAHIRNGATVLSIETVPSPPPDPLLHAAGVLAPHCFVNLSNYEAVSDHFPVRFRPERFPPGIDAEGGKAETCTALTAIPSYERQIGAKVGYVLLYRLGVSPKPATSGCSVPPPGYRLVAATHGRLEAALYERAAP